jgi:NADPH:quinone reductase-like Zn-dependent oxidoreductase
MSSGANVKSGKGVIATGATGDVGSAVVQLANAFVATLGISKSCRPHTHLRQRKGLDPAHGKYSSVFSMVCFFLV